MSKGKTFLLVLFIFLISFSSCFASEIHLSDDEILLNSSILSGENEEGIIYSNQMNNGSSDINGISESIEVHDIITITKPGEYIFTGSLSDGQIAVDANSIEGDVKIILNNVSINAKSAPAIFVYSKSIENDKCKVTILTAKGSVNEVSGGNIKASVENWADKESILYYVEKGYDENNEYFERYKYDGAISSDISINFDGEGILNVIGKNKEGIEGKMHINIKGGTIIIKSVDDAINAATDGKSVITIDGGMVVAFLTEKAEEGDGIDSNGEIYINGGTVYSFACPGSDSGLDADKGTYINGGTVLAVGSMRDSVTFDSGIKYAMANFSKEVNSGDVICVASEEGEIIFAYKADRNIQNFLYSSNTLEKEKNYIVYTNAMIEGEVDEWGVYTNIVSSSLDGATKNEYNEVECPGKFIGELDSEKNKIPNELGIVSLISSVILFIIILLVDINDKDTNAKLKVINLVFGILIGIFLAVGVLVLVNNDSSGYRPDAGRIQYEDRALQPPKSNI